MDRCVNKISTHHIAILNREKLLCCGWQMSGYEKGRIKQVDISRGNAVKESGFVFNVIPSLSIQQEWKKTSQSKYNMGWLLCAVHLCWKVSALMTMWEEGKLFATRCCTVMHCCVIGFLVVLSNLCQHLAIGKSFVSISAITVVPAISDHVT